MSSSDADTGPTTVTFEEANEAGYLGTATDPEPNDSYTVAGVVKAAAAAASTPDTSKASASKSTPSKSSS